MGAINERNECHDVDSLPFAVLGNSSLCTRAIYKGIIVALLHIGKEVITNIDGLAFKSFEPVYTVFLDSECIVREVEKNFIILPRD